MGFTAAVKTCFSQFATFEGRARRSEFWFFYLFLQLVQVAAFMVVGLVAALVLPLSATNGQPAGWALGVVIILSVVVLVGAVVLIVPLLAVWARRLHDMGQSGHWLWLSLVGLSLVPLIMAVLDSQYGPNRWGADPKDAERRGLGGYAHGQFPQGGAGYPPPPPR